MWSNSLAVVLTFAAAASAMAAPTVKCPGYIQEQGVVRKLADAQVFQGPPSEKVELVPVAGNWELADIEGTGSRKPFNLICQYGGTSTVRAAILPKGVVACILTAKHGGTQVVCH